MKSLKIATDYLAGKNVTASDWDCAIYLDPRSVSIRAKGNIFTMSGTGMLWKIEVKNGIIEVKNFSVSTYGIKFDSKDPNTKEIDKEYSVMAMINELKRKDYLSGKSVEDFINNLTKILEFYYGPVIHVENDIEGAVK